MIVLCRICVMETAAAKGKEFDKGVIHCLFCQFSPTFPVLREMMVAALSKASHHLCSTNVDRCVFRVVL